MLAYDVESPDHTDKRRNVLLTFMPRTIVGKTKRCRKGTRETISQLYIDQYIFKDAKARQENVAMAYIDFKKTYGMVPQSWIIECLKYLSKL